MQALYLNVSTNICSGIQDTLEIRPIALQQLLSPQTGDIRRVRLSCLPRHSIELETVVAASTLPPPYNCKYSPPIVDSSERAVENQSSANQIQGATSLEAATSSIHTLSQSA
jgi:hypothetical protein